MGWGEVPPGPPSAADETRSEEEGPRDRTPAVMFVPAAALLAGALAVGLIPGMVDAAQSAARRFVAGGAYDHLVLGGAAPAPHSSPPPYSPPAHAYLYAGLTIAAALGFAGLALFGRSPGAQPGRGAARLGARLLASLRALHSGHIGDYVAWLVAGVAALGGAFAIAFA